VATPETINADPHGQAWMIAVRVSDPKDIEELMDAAAYQAYVGSEAK
jgi:glycine cleavage system H protein